jgi:hypothetical protein
MYVNDMPIPSYNASQSLYADDTGKPALLVRYQESYLSELQRWLREWRIAINVSKSFTMFARA